MSLHKLNAGNGYDYLTRQVARQDATEVGHSGLASYYTAKGEAPGVWVGSGLVGLDGLDAGDVVTAEQMLNLFGSGVHPLAAQVRAEAAAAGMDVAGQVAAARLGNPYRVYSEVSDFRRMVAERMAVINTERGLPAGALGSLQERARVRTQVAVELFRDEHGRDPVDAREIAATIAKGSRPATTAVAGYDLTFSPVKSVSTLWAIADRPVAEAIERAHQLAVRDALEFIEKTALFTREGANGIRQVETRGLIATAFTHRDSRAGDPDLHTHVAVANKVQAKDSGRWLAIDGRLIFKANVAASETYNTRLEHHLKAALGVRFEARPGTDPRKRPVREIVGVNPALNERWSTRRAIIEARRVVLNAQFQLSHGRPPSPVESIQLAQQATLETRQEKHEPRSLAEQRTAWSAQANEVLGGPTRVRAMVAGVLSPSGHAGERVDAASMAATATRIHEILQGSRSHWQRWHVHAEALRQVRDVNLTAADLERVVHLLVDQVIAEHCIPLTRPGDELDVPPELRRSDGASVYTIAGAQRFTSATILAAEARIVARAGQFDAARVPATVVDQALADSAATGLPLNAGQAMLVRSMATSGARVQLAIAPAGAGKTTAMQALAQAWTGAGGTVIGLAPSAAAADVLGQAIETTTDTLAKLAWHLHHPDLGALPEWAQRIGSRTLVVVDEAGMADTLSLDRVIEYVASRGAAVRLIGDDQQLAAVGAGGVLRDIQATHGSLHLSELMRFTNPAEGVASLALRDGLPEALGFYLDNARVVIGDQATLTDDVFTAWTHDRDAGRDSIMLAPTRALVVELNHRARTHRLTTAYAHNRTPAPASASVVLADGNHASAGDLIITRTNDRTLRTAATDWVKNGDRWHITTAHGDGSLTVQHTTSRRVIDLPASYVTASVELGYATTIHTSQGVTADTSHTLLTGEESRQLAYTAITRGRGSNHVYLQVVGDGNEHNIVRPDHTHPPTATDILETILARDDSAQSATSIARDDTDPATGLGAAVDRYLDSLAVAAELRYGPDQVTALEQAADRILAGLTDSPAWPTLRAHLLLIAAAGANPIHALHQAATSRPIDTAADPAAVISWRLDESGMRNTAPGPLPWIPAIPTALTEDPQWGPYLAARAATVRHLRDQITEHASTSRDLPAWARQGHARPETDLLTDITIWRAATGVDPADRRPTGPPHTTSTAAKRWQEALTARLNSDRAPALAEWRPFLETHLTNARRDPFTPLLAQRLAALTRSGIDAPTLVRQALARGPLPDDHNAAALWWRITAGLSPAVAAQSATDHQLTSTWTEQLPDLIGPDPARALRESTWWPTLVTVIDHALARGNTLPSLLHSHRSTEDQALDVDPCQTLVWRLSLLTDPHTHASGNDTGDHVGHDRYVGDADGPSADDLEHAFTDQPDWAPTAAECSSLPQPEAPPPEHDASTAPPSETDDAEELFSDADVDAALSLAAMRRELAGILQPTDREIETQLARAHQADIAEVSPERIAHLNQMALAFYTSAYPGSWAQHYLTERMRTDLTGHPVIQPGYAPPGWTTLVSHLRAHGATDLELTESGLASIARTGRLIDRFRDRLILPITRQGRHGQLETIGFVARRNPATDHTGPKYLNTPDTVLFHKGAQLYSTSMQPSVGVTPVLVEGPLDAIAIHVAGGGQYVGMAPLGSSLTEEQARELAQAAALAGRKPIVATDHDPAGQAAAERDYWLLTQHGASPQSTTLRAGSDPADTLTHTGPDSLRRALDRHAPLSAGLISERLTNLTGIEAARQAVAVLAADHPANWANELHRIAAATDVDAARLGRALVWNATDHADDPRGAATQQINNLAKQRHTPPVKAAHGDHELVSLPHRWEQDGGVARSSPHPDRRPGR